MTDEEMSIAKDIQRCNGQYYGPDSPKCKAAVLMSKFEGGKVPLDTMIEKYIPPPV